MLKSVSKAMVNPVQYEITEHIYCLLADMNVDGGMGNVEIIGNSFLLLDLFDKTFFNVDLCDFYEPVIIS